MVTIKEIAQKCGVSIATVSNILNGKPNASEATKARVLKAVDELNYTPNSIAKNLKLKKSMQLHWFNIYVVMVFALKQNT